MILVIALWFFGARNVGGDVQVIAPEKSAIEFQPKNPTLFLNSPKATGRNSLAETYLLNHDGFSEDELKHVKFKLISTKVSRVFHKEANDGWTCWLPTGRPMPGENPAIPEQMTNRSKSGQTYLLVEQQSLRQSPNEALAGDADVVVFSGAAGQIFTQNKCYSWVLVREPYGSYADIPFTILQRDTKAARLKPIIGDTTTIDGVQFTVSSIEVPTKQSGDTAVVVKRNGPSSVRNYCLSADVDSKLAKQQGSYVSTWVSQLGSGVTRIGSNAKLGSWHGVNIDREVAFYGYFGHVAMKPNP